jgi:hypothetical protein
MTVADGRERSGDAEIRFVWDYAQSDGRLRALYDRGKAAQWNATTDINWAAGVGTPGHVGLLGSGLPLERDASPVPPERWAAFQWEFHSWMTSQFLHGEQGALLAAGRLVAMVPDMDTKFYAAAQAADEARHVEAYARYVELLGNTYPVGHRLPRHADHR